MTCYFRGFFDTLIAATGSYRKLDSLRDAPPLRRSPFPGGEGFRVTRRKFSLQLRPISARIAASMTNWRIHHV